jgi:hypothetical protein
MTCDEKAKLMKTYELTTAEFSEAVTDLRQRMGTVTQSEYNRLSHLADDARLKSEAARLALERHVAEHGC